jgi:four helix bundle protein
MQKSRDLRERSFQFTVDVIAFTRLVMTTDSHLRPVTWQLLDSAGSTGANLEEAAEGQSKRDFIAKNYTALKEARESRYWLRVIAASSPRSRESAKHLADDASELIAMLVSCVKSAKSNLNRGRPQ